MITKKILKRQLRKVFLDSFQSKFFFAKNRHFDWNNYKIEVLSINDEITFNHELICVFFNPSSNEQPFETEKKKINFHHHTHRTLLFGITGEKMSVLVYKTRAYVSYGECFFFRGKEQSEQTTNRNEKKESEGWKRNRNKSEGKTLTRNLPRQILSRVCWKFDYVMGDELSGKFVRFYWCVLDKSLPAINKLKLIILLEIYFTLWSKVSFYKWFT